MKFDTPATDQSDRPAEGRRQADRPDRRPAQDHRAPRPMPTSGTMSCRTKPMATSSARRSPRAGSPSIDLERRQGGARRARHRHGARMPASSARASSTPPAARRPRDPALSPGDRASSSRKPSSRRAPPRSWCVSTTSAAEGAFDLAARKDARATGRSHRGPPTPRSAISPARSRPRRSSSTRPTRRPTRRTR